MGEQDFVVVASTQTPMNIFRKKEMENNEKTEQPAVIKHRE